MVGRAVQFVGGHKRWLIVVMLAGFSVVNYVDRQALSVLAPPIVAMLALWLGWRWAFSITGAAGFVLLAPWWRFYDTPERHRGLSDAEREHILKNRGAAPAKKAEAPTSYLTNHFTRPCVSAA